MAMFQKRHYEFLADHIRTDVTNEQLAKDMCRVLGTWFAFHMEGFNRARWDKACSQFDDAGVKHVRGNSSLS